MNSFRLIHRSRRPPFSVDRSSLFVHTTRTQHTWFTWTLKCEEGRSLRLMVNHKTKLSDICPGATYQSRILFVLEKCARFLFQKERSPKSKVQSETNRFLRLLWNARFSCSATKRLGLVRKFYSYLFRQFAAVYTITGPNGVRPRAIFQRNQPCLQSVGVAYAIIYRGKVDIMKVLPHGASGLTRRNSPLMRICESPWRPLMNRNCEVSTSFPAAPATRVFLSGCLRL